MISWQPANWEDSQKQPFLKVTSEQSFSSKRYPILKSDLITYAPITTPIFSYPANALKAPFLR